MNGRRDEIMTQSVHGQERGGHGGIAEVVSEGAASEVGTGSGFGSHNGDVLAVDLVPYEGQADAGKITAASGASQNHIRIQADFLQSVCALRCR